MNPIVGTCLFFHINDGEMGMSMSATIPFATGANLHMRLTVPAKIQII